MKILDQLRHDFPGAEFAYTGIFLSVNGRKSNTCLTSNEIAVVDPATRKGRKYYRFFANLVYNHFGIKPRPGSLAEFLIIDQEEARRAAIAAWLSEHRIAFIDDGQELEAISYEVAGDRPPASRVTYESPAEVEYLEETPPPTDEHTMESPPRSREKQAEWEARLIALAAEGEQIKREMKEEWSRNHSSPFPGGNGIPGKRNTGRIREVIERVLHGLHRLRGASDEES